MSLQQYMSLRRNARVVRDEEGYRLDKGEANYVIFEDFIGELLELFPAPVTWEPFAGHTGRCKSCDFCDDIGTKHIAYDLAPVDFRVSQDDSTLTGPGERIHGMLFHPPYFGSATMSPQRADLSTARSANQYITMLSKTIKLAHGDMVMGGLVAAICRDYRHNGDRIRLDQWVLGAFERIGFKLTSVWSSEPDVILIFER
jgi:hypothetical protein